MSHYTQIGTKIVNREYLVKALVESGFDLADIEIHDTPTHLFGYMDDRRKDMADVIIRRSKVGGSSNDIGFIKDDTGNYQAIISEYDSRNGGYNTLANMTYGYNDEWLGRLTGFYAMHAAKAELTAQGCEVEVTRDHLGNIKVIGKRQTILGKLKKKVKQAVSIWG